MEKCFRYLLKINPVYKSFDQKIKVLFEHYFLDKKFISILNSNQFLLKDKIKKLKNLENKALAELHNILKDHKKHQNIKDNFLNLIQEFYIYFIKFYPTNEELVFIKKISFAVSRKSNILLEEISNNPIYFNYSKAFLETKEAKFAIAKEVRNYA